MGILVAESVVVLNAHVKEGVEGRDGITYQMVGSERCHWLVARAYG